MLVLALARLRDSRCRISGFVVRRVSRGVQAVIKTKEVTIPAQPERKESREVGVACDFCGRELDRVSHLDAVSITRISGTPDHHRSGFSDTSEYDLCGNCFVVHIKHILDEFAKTGPRVTEKFWPD
jgi:hypothetical protein